MLGVKTRGKTLSRDEGADRGGRGDHRGEGQNRRQRTRRLHPAPALQKIEHYEIAGYGSARTFASILGEDEVASLLQATLDVEGAAAENLTAIAEGVVNPDAAGDDDEDE